MRFAALAIAAAALVATVLPASAMEIVTGQRTSQPRGHWELCQSRPIECTARTRATRPVAMNDQVMGLLRSVNDRVNRAVRPMTDMQQHGVVERWSYPGTYGDCEDYVLAKRHMLLSYGFKPGDLLITVVEQANGEGHAVLTVRTSQGDFVLDNLDASVRHWTQTGYRYVKRQSERHAGTWVDIVTPNARLAMR